jgi:hypothetical protein
MQPTPNAKKPGFHACSKRMTTPWMQPVIFCSPSLANEINISCQRGHNTSNTLQACEKICSAVWPVYMGVATRWKLCISPLWKKKI